MEGEFIGMAINVQDEKCVTGKGGREMVKRLEGPQGQGRMILSYVCMHIAVTPQERRI